VTEQTSEAYHATLALAKTHNIKLKSTQELVEGPGQESVERIGRLQQMKPSAPNSAIIARSDMCPASRISTNTGARSRIS